MTTLIYKLTNQDMTTHGGFRYELGVRAVAKGNGKDLCSGGFLHAYESPLLAVLHNPIHADYRNPRLFEAETEDVPLREGQMKLGVKSMTLVREIQLPVITPEQRTRYGIYCALMVYSEPGFVRWANAWLSGENQSRAETAEAEAEAAWAAWAAEAAEAATRANPSLDLIAIAQKAVL